MNRNRETKNTFTSTTLRSAAGLSDTPPALIDAALVLIDVQREYGPAGQLPLSGFSAAMDNIVDLLTRARERNVPIIHVVHRGKSGGLFDPQEGGETLSAVEPLHAETIVEKRLPNAFAGTDLAHHVDRFDRPELILVGFMTHMCVSTTARAALDLGLTTTIASDATATRDLPDSGGRGHLAASVVHEAALAALGDRFSRISTANEIV